MAGVVPMRVGSQELRRVRAWGQALNDLQTKVNDTVSEYCALRRARLAQQWEDGWRPAVSQSGHMYLAPPGASPVLGQTIPPAILDSLQPQKDELDPVVELALMAADYGNTVELRRLAAASAADFLRPKLKAVMVSDGTGDVDTDDRRAQLASCLREALDDAASLRSSAEAPVLRRPSEEEAT